MKQDRAELYSPSIDDSSRDRYRSWSFSSHLETFEAAFPICLAFSAKRLVEVLARTLCFWVNWTESEVD